MPDETNPTLSREYRGHHITFAPGDLKFHITDFCSSFIEVEDAIKARAKNVVLDEIVLNESGERIRITAINRQTGQIKEVNDKYIYPNLTWVADALKRMNHLNTEAKELYNLLSSLQISSQRVHGRISTDDYGLRVDRLRQTINEKLELAKQNDPVKSDSNVEEFKQA